MKIIKEAPGEPTVIQIETDESCLIFYADGKHEAFVASPDNPEDENALAKASMVEVCIALIALQDPQIRAMIEDRFSNA